VDIHGFELAEMTIAQLGEAMETGERTAASIATAYLERIERIDPDLRSVIAIDPDAVGVASRLDEERRTGLTRGPLHGIPVLVKDNIETVGGPPTTAGSLALAAARPERDATLVARLREAGAVILGKANLSEWANFRSTRSSSGWSAVGGQCRNPYALDRNPSGSSSGSGVAVSANLCGVAIGTETDGSIVSPSTHNGIVGHKPTVGVVSRAGVIPISHTQDTPGPMTRTVADAVAVLLAMAGRDERDRATRDLDGAFVRREDLRGVRIGVARNLGDFTPAVVRLFDDAVEALRNAGASTADIEVPHVNELDDPEWEVLEFEFKADLDAYLSTAAGSTVRSLEELIAFDLTHPAEEMPFFGQEILESSLEKGPLTDPAYLEALATSGRLSREEGLDVALGDAFDVLVTPSAGPAWLTDHVNGDAEGPASSTPAAVSGYPSVSVPMGEVSGLPVGLSFIGRPWTDLELLAIAEVYERETCHRAAPRFLSSAS
jgi:amidase